MAVRYVIDIIFLEDLPDLKAVSYFQYLLSYVDNKRKMMESIVDVVEERSTRKMH